MYPTDKPKSIQKWEKKYLIALIVTTCISIFVYFWIMQDIVAIVNQTNSKIMRAKKQITNLQRSKGTKYVLLWDKDEYNMLQSKINKDVTMQNCVFTDNRDLLNRDYTRFHAIIFNEKHLSRDAELPNRRACSQVYFFTTTETDSFYPACEVRSDDFFNMTFTYRLDSDIVRNYFTVRDVDGDVVAPCKYVDWWINYHSIPKTIKALFKKRRRAVAWIVSRCESNSLRDDYIMRLREHLLHYSLEIDVFGSCGATKCHNDDCDAMLRETYYFYVAFEDSFAVDFVTAKVLQGYHNYVVPIVYGGANYSRFLPTGSYLNAQKYDPYNLAHTIYKAVINAKEYESYFTWTNYYTIRPQPPKYEDICDALRSENSQDVPAIKSFRVWWNTLDAMKLCLPLEHWNKTSLSNTEKVFSLLNKSI